MASFNLIDKDWIPVRTLNDEPEKVSLRDALVRAHELQEVYTDSPMQTAALYRLLLALRLAIFPEALSEDSDEGWFALWDKGHLPKDRVRQYLDEQCQRFDLFDEQYPFYQDASLAEKEPEKKSNKLEQSIAQTKMFIEETGSAVLFNHTFHNAPRLIDPAAAARGLVSLHFAGPSDGQSMQIKGEARIPGKSPGVLMNSAMFWIRGDTLFEALMLNAPPDIGLFPTDSDRPTWAREERVDSKKTGRPVYGPLDYLTWQTRRILLLPHTDEAGQSVVKEARMVQGESIKFTASGGEPTTVDPLMVLTGGSKGKPNYYQFQKGRALWRDAHVFLKLLDKNAKRLPKNFEWVQNQRGSLKRKRWRVDVFGIRTDGDPGRFALWRHERMPLHVAYLDLDNVDLRSDLQVCLALAEKDIAPLLGDACYRFARLLRYPGSPPSRDNPKREAGLKEQEKKEVKNLFDSLQHEEHFWPALEAPFYELMERLAAVGEPYDEDAANGVKKQWRETVKQVALRTFRQTTASCSQDARTLRAIASAEEVLRYGNKPRRKRGQTLPERLL